MAVVELPGGFFFPHRLEGALAFNAGMLFNAADEAVATVFQFPKTGNVRKVHWATGTVTTGDTIKVRLETVSTTDGNPTGTLFAANSANDAVVVAGGDDNVHFATTLTADCAVTKGALAALVIQNSAAGTGNMIIRALDLGLGTPYVPYPLLKTASYSKIGNLLVFALEYDDASIVPIHGITPPTTGTTTTTLATNATPDVLGLRFTAATNMRVVGAWVRMDNDGDVDIRLVSTAYNQGAGTGILAQTGTIDAQIRTAATVGYHSYYFTAVFDCVAGTVYRLVCEPTTTTAVAVYDVSLPSLAMLDAWAGQTFHLTTAKDPTADGDWTNFNSGTFRMPLMGLLVSGFDNASGATPGGSSRSRVQRRM